MSIKDQDMSEICFETCWPRARSNIPGRPRSHTERVVEGGQCLQKECRSREKDTSCQKFPQLPQAFMDPADPDETGAVGFLQRLCKSALRRSFKMLSGGSGKQPSTLATGTRSRVQAYRRVIVLKSWIMPWRFEGAKEWREWGTEHSPSCPSHL